mgnify:CR=1 FL=1
MHPPTISHHNAAPMHPDASVTAASQRDLFVGNLSFFCQEKHLKELFSRFGDVASIRIKRNDKGGRSLMYGFISMATAPAAKNAAISLHQQLFMGRNIR